MGSWQDGNPMTRTVKHMQVICKLFEPRYEILPYMWRIGIECKMQQILGVFYRCEEFACMLHIISLRAQVSQNVKYWYEICDVLFTIFHALWRIGTYFSQCEICEMWNLRFNKAFWIGAWQECETCPRVFFSWCWREDPNTTIRGPTSARQRNAI